VELNFFAVLGRKPDVFADFRVVIDKPFSSYITGSHAENLINFTIINSV
jgi:hypothetical protein